MLTSSTQRQNRSFHVVERTRTSTKCQKMKNARAKRAKILFFIVKYANLLGFRFRCRRGCLSSLIPSYAPIKRKLQRSPSARAHPGYLTIFWAWGVGTLICKAFLPSLEQCLPKHYHKVLSEDCFISI